jgi:hypothetical protein
MTKAGTSAATPYVLLLYTGDYEEREVSEVRLFGDRDEAISALATEQSAIRERATAWSDWQAAVERTYQGFKPDGWSDFQNRDNPHALNGRHAESWRRAASRHPTPVGTNFTQVDLFEVDGGTSRRIEEPAARRNGPQLSRVDAAG